MARVVNPRRERGKGRQPPSKARPRVSNRPVAARKARQSVESGSTSNAERSNVGEKKVRSSLSQEEGLRGATTTNQIFRREENRTSVSPLPSKYPSSSRSPRSSVARDPETHARDNTRRSPARATLEESGRTSKHEGREAKASGVPDQVQD